MYPCTQYVRGNAQVMERLVLAKEIAGTREKTLGSATDFPGSTKQIQLDTKFRSNHEKSSVKMGEAPNGPIARDAKERKEMRAQEAVALAETIKILNDVCADAQTRSVEILLPTCR